MKSQYKVLVYYHIPEFLKRYEKLVKEERSDLTLYVCDRKEQIERHIHEADILFSGHTFPVDLLPKAKNLKWIQSISAGVENFVLSSSIPENVTLTKITGVHGPIMSEYVLGYILAITLNMKNAFENQKKKDWPYYVPDTIRAKTVGVIGLGSVGACIAYKLHLAGADVIGLEEQEKRLPYMRREYLVSEMEEFLGDADFVVMSLPLTPQTKGIFGKDEFAMMKKSAYFINVSRGPLVQEQALVDALKNKNIAGAILDVFTEEPLPKTHELWKLDNVIITPHISGPSIPEDIAKVFLDNLRRFEQNKELVGVVDRHKGY
jgi:phosphoglycerate dehydrogenase-like enzyme